MGHLFIDKNIQFNLAHRLAMLNPKDMSEIAFPGGVFDDLGYRVSVMSKVIRRYYPFLPVPEIRNKKVYYPDFEDFIPKLAIAVKDGSLFLPKNDLHLRFLSSIGLDGYIISSLLKIKDRSLHYIEESAFRLWEARSRESDLLDAYTFLGKIDVKLINSFETIRKEIFDYHYIGFIRNLNHRSVAIATVFNYLNKECGWDTGLMLDVEDGEIILDVSDGDIPKNDPDILNNPIAIRLFSEFDMNINVLYNYIDESKTQLARHKIKTGEMVTVDELIEQSDSLNTANNRLDFELGKVFMEMRLFIKK